jgi:hypothetical protein
MALWLVTAGVAWFAYNTPDWTEDWRLARRWLWAVALPWLDGLVAWPALTTYRHLTGRERRRRAWQRAREQACRELVGRWSIDVIRYRDAGYPLSAAVTENSADLMRALAAAFAADAEHEDAPLVLAAPTADVSHLFEDAA